MSALRSSHAVWLLRRAAVLDGTSADAGNDPLDPVRATMMRRISAQVTEMAEGHSGSVLTPADRALLASEADELTSRAAKELERTDARDLQRAEEWVRTAQALREILDATSRP